MRWRALILVLLLPFLMGQSRRVVLLQPAVAAGPTCNGNGIDDADICDDFSAATIGDWVQESCTWTISGGELLDPGSNCWIRYDTVVASDDQWMCFRISSTPVDTTCIVLRAPDNSTGERYTLCWVQAFTDVRWFREVPGSSDDEIEESAAEFTMTAGDSLCAEVKGTGDATTMEWWYFDGASPSQDRADWDVDSDDHETFTDNPDSACAQCDVDTGVRVGFWEDGGTDIGDFWAGD